MPRMNIYSKMVWDTEQSLYGIFSLNQRDVDSDFSSILGNCVGGQAGVTPGYEICRLCERLFVKIPEGHGGFYLIS